ncbi:MAG: hypothetical protein IRZ08_02860 [Frankia sp.]|nr:hypothetical protein [Frankia sp.]
MPAPVIPWEFGVDPLPQTGQLAARLRRVLGLALALERPEPAVDELIAALDAAERALADRVPPDPAPRVGDAVDGDGRVYVGHARDIGGFNPCFPEYEISVDGDQASGTVTFPVVYEGPPGIVHGGFLALFFDCVIQHHNCEVGQSGKTVELALRYRRPTPLLRRLRFTLTRAVEATRIHSTGQLLDGDVVLCEARMEAVRADRSKLPAVSPRRLGA